MAEDIAKNEFRALIEAQETVEQDLSRRLKIDSLAMIVCCMCLAYQDQVPHLVNKVGERIDKVKNGTAYTVAQMGFHCGQRGPQKQAVRDV
jgi:hypothetical protein